MLQTFSRFVFRVFIVKEAVLLSDTVDPHRVVSCRVVSRDYAGSKAFPFLIPKVVPSFMTSES